MREIDELTYRSYRWQRIISPQIDPARWAKLFANAAEMEERFQKELKESNEKNALRAQ